MLGAPDCFSTRVGLRNSKAQTADSTFPSSTSVHNVMPSSAGNLLLRIHYSQAKYVNSRWADKAHVYLPQITLIWLNSRWSDSTHVDLTQFALIWLNSRWSDSTRVDLTQLTLIWLNSRRSDSTHVDLTQLMSIWLNSRRSDSTHAPSRRYVTHYGEVSRTRCVVNKSTSRYLI